MKMLCFYYKWKVSRFLDQDQGISPGVSRHLARCRSCGDFYRASQLMAGRLAEEKAAMTNPVPGSVVASILSSVDESSKRGSPPAKRRLRLMLPAAAFSTLAIFVFVSYFWLLAPSKKSITPGMQLPLLFLDKPQQEVHGLVQRIESPIQQEARQLKESFRSATSFLKSCLDIKITKARIL
jgi:hypothetical protein